MLEVQAHRDLQLIETEVALKVTDNLVAVFLYHPVMVLPLVVGVELPGQILLRVALVEQVGRRSKVAPAAVLAARLPLRHRLVLEERGDHL